MRKFLFTLILGNFMLFCHGQNKTLSGSVTTSTKEPIPGVSVTVPGTNLGTVTNPSGMFSISVPASARTLELSYVGYKRKTVPIGSGGFQNLTLEEGTGS